MGAWSLKAVSRAFWSLYFGLSKEVGLEHSCGGDAEHAVLPMASPHWARHTRSPTNLTFDSRVLTPALARAACGL